MYPYLKLTDNQPITLTLNTPLREYQSYWDGSRTRELSVNEKVPDGMRVQRRARGEVITPSGDVALLDVPAGVVDAIRDNGYDPAPGLTFTLTRVRQGSRYAYLVTNIIARAPTQAPPTYNDSTQTRTSYDITQRDDLAQILSDADAALRVISTILVTLSRELEKRF